MEMIHAFEPSERTSAAGALRPSLLRVVQTEILPRLPLVHRPPRAATTQNESAEPERLANLAFGPDRDGVADYLTFLQRRGASSEALLLDMIAPAARHLGALWEQDLCDFIEVTQGLGRLRAAAQDLLAEPDDPLGRDRADPRVLLTLAPGETHRLGAAIAAGLFRFAGFFCGNGGRFRGEDRLGALCAARLFDLLRAASRCAAKRDRAGPRGLAE